MSRPLSPDSPDLPNGASGAALASALGPALVQHCDGRLSDIAWFRSDWQRGGAGTGYATWTFDDGSKRDVVVKLPIGPTEHRFLVGLAKTDAPTPRIVAEGSEIAGYDLAWAVMERCPGSPMARSLTKEHFQELCDAAARFYKHALDVCPVDKPAPEPDWAAALTKSREATKNARLNHASHWNDLIHKVQKCLDRFLPTWLARAVTGWRHGDLHPGNAMHRPEGSPWGPAGCVLLDLAEVRPGHWVEDAIYLEHLHWSRPEALDGVKCVSLLAKARRAVGLDTSDDYPTLANIRRVLYAATAPANIRQEGSSAHLDASLKTLERLLPVVSK